MKKSFCAALLAGAIASGTASAALIDNGGGLIYDTTLNVTWLNYTYSPPGYYGVVWDWANDWAAGLNAGGVSGWRLPVGYSTTQGQVSEMQQLVVDELGNTDPGALINKGLMTELISGVAYWLGPDRVTWDKAVVYELLNKQEEARYDNWPAYALAVHDGNIAPVPVPSTVVLFLSGLATLFTTRRKTFGRLR